MSISETSAGATASAAQTEAGTSVTDTATTILDFIVENYLFGDTAGAPGPADSLVESGIIDSTGVLELIEFLDSEFGVVVAENETVPENLDSVENLVAYIERKRAA